MSTFPNIHESEIQIPTAEVNLEGNLSVPAQAQAIVLFAHGSGSSRFSPRNRYVAEILNQAGLGTILFDLLTAREQEVDFRTRQLRFDIELLSSRLTDSVDWVIQHPQVGRFPIGLFGASTGAAAALITAAQRPENIAAVVSRGGRPDLAEDALSQVRAPTLLIVGGYDLPVLDLNQEAEEMMQTETRIEVVPGASHLFEEPGKLDEVARLARDWFHKHMVKRTAQF